ncbi:MAG TPA: N-acetylmuramoyl-L-alanine amidase [Acidimicrobiia bacterium]|nr:N-acetylmuramoyl-L-alanine amidase [Acidimicrobiia bacterium]
MSPLTRRQFLGTAAALATASYLPSSPARAVSINPRSSWATNRPPKGPMPAEDVRFLIVHHSASRNGHTGADAPAILRSFYDFHTSAEKGWNDIAYNFLIDADGGVWEGRAGSLDGPVAADATGGNQGFSQLVCLIGDFNAAQPSPAALSSMVATLAWLADRYSVPTAPGSQVTFASRGSNRHPAGASVTTPTITGHRTMSQTTCPGDNLNAYVVGELMADVTATRGGATVAPATTSTSSTAPTTTSTTTSTTTTTTVPSTTTTAPTTTLAPTTTAPEATTTLPSTTLPASVTGSTQPVVAASAVSDPGMGPLGLAVPAGAIAATGAGLLIWRHRRLANRGRHE